MGVALILRIFYPGNWFGWICRHPDKPMDDGIQSGSLTALTSFSADANWSRTSPSCRRRLSAVVVSSQICVLLDWISQRACSTSHFSWCTPHSSSLYYTHYYHYTHTHLTALCPGLLRWAGTRKVTSIWILLKQETVSVSGISWAICKSAPRSRQITTPAPQHSVFYRPDALPAAQPTASKHWRHAHTTTPV